VLRQFPFTGGTSHADVFQGAAESAHDMTLEVGNADE